MQNVDVEVVDIRKITGDGSLRAFADLKVGSLIIKGFSVLEGKNGIFVSLPKKAAKDGRWFEMITPLDERLKQEMQDKVLEAYDRETDGVSH